MSKCKQIAVLCGGKYEKIYESARRVYSTDGICPTIHTMWGGNLEIKVLDGFNGRINTNADTINTLRTHESKSNGNGIKLIEHDLRVRCLTERECGKLMGIKTVDIAKIGKNLSKSAMYHCFGDSIVTTCLMAIFGEMLGVEWQGKVQALADELHNDQ